MKATKTLPLSDSSEGTPSLDLTPRDSLVGQMLGKIRVHKVLGSGGMGKVYAGYDETLKRPVALKSIQRRHGRNQEMKGRFLQEAQILSRLQHPNICRIYDYLEGENADFLVLELIEGHTLKQAFSESLSYEQKLALALQLCEALAAAHGAGVVHRDLKPANVMVTPKGQIKMLDFGIAQSFADTATAELWSNHVQTVESETSGERPSPARMPVDLEGDTVALTGAQAGAQLEPTSAAEKADLEPGQTLTQEQKPQGRPSKWQLENTPTVVTPPDAPPSSHGPTVGRSTVPADLAFRTKTGALVGTPQFMSPEQARGERASSASDMYSLGLVLQQLFTGESPYPQELTVLELIDAVQNARTLPVEGLPSKLALLIERLTAQAPGARPSAQDTMDRLRWIQQAPVRRRRRLRRNVLFAFLALVAVAMAFLAFRIQQEAERAHLAAELAEQEAETTRQVLDFFISVFDDSNPWESRREKVTGQELTVREALDRGLSRLRQDLDDKPEIRARLLQSVGRAQLSLGHSDQAEPLLREALELRRQVSPGQATLGQTQSALGTLLRFDGRIEEAEVELQGAADHLSRLFESSEAGRGRQKTRGLLIEALKELGILRAETGRLEEARDTFRRALQLQQDASEDGALPQGASKDSPAVLLTELATVEEMLGDLPAAEALLRQALATLEQQMEAANPHLANALNRLGVVLDQQNQVDEAAQTYRRALEIVVESLGPDHPLAGTIHMNLGSVYRKQMRFEDADLEYQKARDNYEQTLDSDHLRFAELYGNWGSLQLDTGHYDDSRASLLQAEGIFRKAFGDQHPAVAMCLGTLAGIGRHQGHWQESEAYYGRAIELFGATLGEQHPQTLESRRRLAELWLDQQRWQEAGNELDRLAAVDGPFDESALTLVRAKLEIGRQQWSAAEDLLDQVGPQLEEIPNRPNLVSLAWRLRGHLDRLQGRPEEALGHYREARTVLADRRSADHPRWIPQLRAEAEALNALGRGQEAEAKSRQADQLAKKYNVVVR